MNAKQNRDEIGFIFQAFSLLPTLNAIENNLDASLDGRHDCRTIVLDRSTPIIRVRGRGSIHPLE